MNPTAKGGQLLGCIGEVLWVGGSCHHRFALFVALVVLSTHRNLKLLHVKKAAQEALFDDEINWSE
jgi:hypothetical protein